jgi:PAS domain S-box-containing protein
MDDKKKTKAQLLEEVADLRRQIEGGKIAETPGDPLKDLYQTILDQIEDGYYEVDLRGRYTYVNRSVCKYHGRTSQELLGQSYRTFMKSSEAAQEVFLIFNQIFRTGQPAQLFEYQIIRKDGVPRDLEVSASLIRDREGNPLGFRGISRDITERKIAEVQLERYKEFFEHSTDAFYELDLRGRITFVNEEACRLFGFTKEEFKGMDYRAYTSPMTAQKLFSIYNEIYRTGKPSEAFEYEVIHRGREIHFMETKASLIIDPKGNPIGFRGITRDITARKKLEAERERYRDFIENISDWCYELDLQGKFLFVNEAMARRMGRSRDQIIGTNNLAQAPPEEAELLQEVFNEVYRTGLPSKVIEYKHIRRDGETAYYQLSVSPIRDGRGQTIGFRGITRDVTERKKLEAEQERYREFVENIEDGCYELDLNGTYTFVNEAACRRFGYTREEFIGLNHREMSSPETTKAMFKVFNEIFKTGEPSPLMDIEVFGKNKQKFFLQTRASLIRDASGSPIGFRGVSRDITQRKKMEAENLRYRNFVKHVSDGCFEMDLDGNIIFFNQALYTRLGYSAEHYETAAERREIIIPESLDKFRKAMQEVLRTGLPSPPTEYDVKHQDGSVIPMEVVLSLIRDRAGDPVGYRGISRDVTERKKMEAEQERYRSFLENIEDGCYEQDLAGNYTFVNEASTRIFGYSREELLKLSFRDLTTPENANKLIPIFNEIFKTGQPNNLIESELIRKDGSTIYVHTGASLIHDAAGNPIGFRGVSRDITERKKMEAETQRLTEQLNQARKMEAIGTLAGGVAHDFNNLLMGIQGYTSLMLLDIDPTHPFHDKLKAIEDQVKSAASLTSQLLGYAQGGRYEVRPFNINTLVHKTASLFGRTKKEIRIHETYTDHPWTLEGDQGQMEQIFLNLFMNAWQAMPGGGVLYLTTENVQLDKSYVEPYGIKPGPYIKVSVTDTGVGMDRETQARIFEPFFTTKEMGRGIGLGLATVYGIVHGHGGIINVYSEKGFGTTFNLYFPTSDKKIQSEGRALLNLVKGNETVLLADDERMITETTGAMLKRLGYRVLTAASGEEAVEILRDHSKKIDAVILDLVMPGIGGSKTFDFLRSINPQAKIILSSGFSLNGEAREILKRGARAFLQKPFLMEELSRVLRQVLDTP